MILSGSDLNNIRQVKINNSSKNLLAFLLGARSWGEFRYAKYLTVNGVSRDEIIEFLWPDPDTQADSPNVGISVKVHIINEGLRKVGFSIYGRQKVYRLAECIRIYGKPYVMRDVIEVSCHATKEELGLPALGHFQSNHLSAGGTKAHAKRKREYGYAS